MADSTPTDTGDGSTPQDQSASARQVTCQAGENERGTPKWFIRKLMDAVGGKFDVDASTHPDTEPFPIADTRFTKSDDGLSQDWFGDVWLNPPYSNLDDWLAKAHTEAQTDRVTRVITLLPANTSTQWFHRHAAKADFLCCVEGRLSFLGDGSDSSAPFASILLLFGSPNEAILRAFDDLGAVYTRQELESATTQSSLNDLWSTDGGAVATTGQEANQVAPSPASSPGPTIRDLSRRAHPTAPLDFNRIGLGDEFYLEFHETMGFPDVPVAASYEVLAGAPATDAPTQTPDDSNTLLCVHEPSETYVCLYQSPDNLSDIQASISAHGGPWQDAHLDTLHRRLDAHTPNVAQYHGTTYINDGTVISE
jgi:phage N-6-adenine-methyltransferase